MHAVFIFGFDNKRFGIAFAVECARKTFGRAGSFFNAVIFIDKIVRKTSVGHAYFGRAIAVIAASVSRPLQRNIIQNVQRIFFVIAHGRTDLRRSFYTHTFGIAFLQLFAVMNRFQMSVIGNAKPIA